MDSFSKDIGTKTTIWRQESVGLCLLKTLPGLPFGQPQMGQFVNIPEFGEAQCSGVNESGTGLNKQVLEIKLTVK